MQRFGTSEDDDEMGMGMDVKDKYNVDAHDQENNSTLDGVDVGIASTSSGDRFIYQQQYPDQPTPQGGMRRCRPHEEKERTKLRERQRRAITAKILAGLRRHGNYNLRVRADINDVIVALAREAGWVVLPDGTTYPPKCQSTRQTGGAPNAAVTESPSQVSALHTSPPTSLRSISPGFQTPVDYSPSSMRVTFVSDSSPYDASPNDLHIDPLLGVSVDYVDNRQVFGIPHT